MADHVVGTNFFLEVARNSFGKYFTTHSNASSEDIDTNERIVWPPTPQIPPGLTFEIRRQLSGTASNVDCDVSFDLIVENIG